jgi:hypothetical protein
VKAPGLVCSADSRHAGSMRRMHTVANLGQTRRDRPAVGMPPPPWTSRCSLVHVRIRKLRTARKSHSTLGAPFLPSPAIHRSTLIAKIPRTPLCPNPTNRGLCPLRGFIDLVQFISIGCVHCGLMKAHARRLTAASCLRLSSAGSASRTRRPWVSYSPPVNHPARRRNCAAEPS